jgi:uncharacterized caspase-like protein
VLVLLGAGNVAAAQPPLARGDGDPAAFALVVGSNLGGEGQAPLRFAENDARHMAEVLRDLGGYRADQVQLALHPTRAEVFRALDVLTARAVAAAAAGRRPRVFFYYSGHARSSALNLGRDELPLTELRERLVGISDGLTIVVLDACQSGAFSRVKGAEPSADFSFNSLARLSATGVAVLASSSASELSQESDRLGSSYFTHHLLVGLRGAGDASGDGKVSLDEAYRYAYHRTLIATTATAVGAQHVSLEVDLRGRGEVALTTPSAADAQLELGAALEGEVLVERRTARAVVAELHKAKGQALRLGLPAAGYRVMVRLPGARTLRQCDVELHRGQVGALALERCDEVALVSESSKGPSWRRPRLSLEFGVGFVRPTVDGFNDRLEDFGYEEVDAPLARAHFAISAVTTFTPNFGLVGSLATLGGGSYERPGEAGPLEYSWQGFAAGLYARGSLPLVGGALLPFVQAGGGVGLAFDELAGRTADSEEATHWGWHLGAGAGLAVPVSRHVALFAEASYVMAPLVDNLLGDTHDAGGALFLFGGRASIYRGVGE